MVKQHNESMSVLAERFIRTLKTKILKIWATNNTKFYLSYLNKLVN